MRKQTQTFKKDCSDAFKIKSHDGKKKNPLIYTITVGKSKNNRVEFDNIILNVDKELQLISKDCKKVDKLIKDKELKMAEIKMKVKKILL